MRKKPTTKAGYDVGLAAEARRTCLYIATILGDLQELLVVVGGIVPYLLVDQGGGVELHVGTRDLDLGLSLGVLDEERYREISQRLRERGFEPAKRDGRDLRQTWHLSDQAITVDFLIPPAGEKSVPGNVQSLEKDFAAIIAIGLGLAFRDFERVSIEGVTPRDEHATRIVRVAGPAAFVAMKALALRLRGENKDAYDLVYMLQNFGEKPVEEIARRYQTFLSDPDAERALQYLAEDFASIDNLGPRRRAEFLGDAESDELRADAFGLVAEFLDRVRAAP